MTSSAPGTGFTVGERVWCNSLGHHGRQGPTSEYCVVASERLYRLPDGADPLRSVALLHPVATAHLGLFTHGRCRRGETVLVHGGAGHVGRAAIRLATGAGARVVATASADGLDACRAAGAAVALDRRDPLLAQRLSEALPAGADVQLDTSGANDLAQAVELLAPRGRIVVMAGMGAMPSLPVGALYTRDGSILGYAISNASLDELADAARSVDELLRDITHDAGHLDVRPLSAAASAHADLEAGTVRGARIVLTPSAS